MHGAWPVLLLAMTAQAAAKAPDGWFPFFLAGGDGSLGAADVSFLNDPPAGDFSWVAPGKAAWDWWSGELVAFRGRHVVILARKAE